MRGKILEIIAYTDPACKGKGLSDEAKEAAGCNGGSSDAFSYFQGMIEVAIGVAALLAVIMIIIGGINYTTSAGDAGKAKKAKDTILYSVIGLVLAILAFAIVNFVNVSLFGDG